MLISKETSIQTVWKEYYYQEPNNKTNDQTKE